MKEALITMITVPLLLMGGIFMVYFMGLIYLLLPWSSSHFWDGDRNSDDNDYLPDRP
jgi:hypothetical protein